MTWLLDAKYHGQGVVIDEMGRTGPEWGYESVGEAASDIRVTRAIWILSLALVLYDWVITLDDEIHFMWSGKFMWTRILFAVSRYWTIVNLIIHNVFLAISDPSDHICKIWYFYFVFSVPGSALPTTFIAQLRIYAMYNCNRRLFFFMFAYVSTTLTFQLPILMLMIVKTETFRLPPTYTACFGTVPYPYTLPYFIQWVPYLTYEIFMFVLAMYKSVLLAREHPETPHLIYVLLRDSLVFYGGTLAMVLVNCLVNALGRPTIFSAFASLYVALYSILGCRMLLNVREAANPWSRYDTALYGLSTEALDERTAISSVRFASGRRSFGFSRSVGVGGGAGGGGLGGGGDGGGRDGNGERGKRKAYKSISIGKQSGNASTSGSRSRIGTSKRETSTGTDTLMDLDPDIDMDVDEEIEIDEEITFAPGELNSRFESEFEHGHRHEYRHEYGHGYRYGKGDGYGNWNGIGEDDGYEYEMTDLSHRDPDSARSDRPLRPLQTAHLTRSRGFSSSMGLTGVYSNANRSLGSPNLPDSPMSPSSCSPHSPHSLHSPQSLRSPQSPHSPHSSHSPHSPQPPPSPPSPPHQEKPLFPNIANLMQLKANIS